MAAGGRCLGGDGNVCFVLLISFLFEGEKRKKRTRKAAGILLKELV